MAVESKRWTIGNIDDFGHRKGWFFGHFMKEKDQALFSNEAEISVKDISDAEESQPHYHKIATEVTFVISGRLALLVDGEEIVLKTGEFIIARPGTLTQNLNSDPNTKVFVVKTPSIPGDKYHKEG